MNLPSPRRPDSCLDPVGLCSASADDDPPVLSTSEKFRDGGGGVGTGGFLQLIGNEETLPANVS